MVSPLVQLLALRSSSLTIYSLQNRAFHDMYLTLWLEIGSNGAETKPCNILNNTNSVSVLDVPASNEVTVKPTIDAKKPDVFQTSH